MKSLTFTCSVPDLQVRVPNPKASIGNHHHNTRASFYFPLSYHRRHPTSGILETTTIIAPNGTSRDSFSQKSTICFSVLLRPQLSKHAQHWSGLNTLPDREHRWMLACQHIMALTDTTSNHVAVTSSSRAVTMSLNDVSSDVLLLIIKMVKSMRYGS